MVDAGGGNFVFWVFRTHEITFSKYFVFVPKMIFVQQKCGGAMAPLLPGCVGPDAR